MNDFTNSSRRNGLLFLNAAFLIALASVAAVAQAPTFKPLTVQSRMAVNGIGPVRIGMSLTKAIDATQASWKVDFSVDDQDCRYAKPEKAISSLAFMVVGGVVVRAEVSSPGIKTISGVQVGDSEAKVKAAYPGKIKVEAHKYDPAGHYLIYMPSDPKDAQYRLLFETDGKVVTSYRAGRVPEVSWIEGCL